MSRDDCIIWDKAKDKGGYGITFAFGKNFRAHRLAWLLRHGELPDDMVVCHACDNPSCVNTDHLFLGTVADNVADMDAKGRRYTGPKPWSAANAARGSDHPLAKLEEWQIPYIRAMIDQGVCQRDIARAYQISPALVCKIGKGEKWSQA